MGPGVDFHQAIGMVSGVKLEFHADEASIVDCSQETTAQVSHLGRFDSDV